MHQFVHVHEHFSFIELPEINGVDMTKIWSHRGAWFTWVSLPLTFGVLDYSESPCLSLSECLIYVCPLASHFRDAWLQWVPLPLTFGVLDYSESLCLSLSGCLIIVSPLASHFRGAWLQWVPSPLTTYQTNIIRDVQKRLLQRLGTCAIDAEVKASFFVTFLQELVPLHYVCDSDHQSKPDVFQCGTGGSDSPSLKTRFTVEREVCNLRLILRWLTCGLNATIPKIAIFNTASLYKLSSIHEPLGKLILLSMQF